RESVYPHSKQFNPNRFLEQKFSPYEYLPFGGGSRSCIGMALSLFEMKLILATLLLNYQLAFNQTHVVKPVRRGITIVPSSNFRLTVLTGKQTKISTKAVNF
ncbi:cytochrome P450, partial [Limnoraphis robusta]